MLSDVGTTNTPSSLRVAYSKGYVYQLEAEKLFLTPIIGHTIIDRYYELFEDGMLKIREGYAWDGMTGWFDTPTNKVYSLVHDVFCQMMRNRQLPHIYKEVNSFCAELGRACGMGRVEVVLVTMAVNLAHSGDPKRGPDKPILHAPF